MHPAAIRLLLVCVILAAFPASAAIHQLIPISSEWKYNQTETNLPPTWKQPAFDDFAWPSGPAPLGREPDNLPVDVATVLSNVTNSRPTFYFRTTFNFPTNPAGVLLQFTNLIDDGAVFYLNGTELFRVRMPPGEITFHTRSMGDVNEAEFQVLRIAPTNLVEGINTLAVEVHQEGPGSGDLVFGTALDYLWPAPVVIDTHPEDIIADEYENERFLVSARGTDLSFTWYHEGIKVGTDSSILFLNEILSTDAGDYFVVISNYANIVTSQVATLTVTNLDVAFPRLLEAYAPVYPSNTNITLVFSEPVIIDRENITVSDEAGNIISIIPWIWTLDSNLLTFAISTLTQNKKLFVTLSKVTDRSGQANPLGFTRAAVKQMATFAGIETPWRYDQTGADLGTEWRMPGFNTEAWPTGPGALGNERGPLPVPIRTFLNFSCCSGEPFATYYFLANFQVDDTNAIEDLRLSLIIDDGAVVYLNGHEIHRVRMPEGTVHYRTLASNTAPEPHQLEGPFIVSATNLVNDQNVLAVEVHQITLSNEDTVFYAELGGLQKGWQPHLSMTQSAEALHLSWADGSTLETRNSFNEVWTSVITPANFLTIQTTNTSQFFRVRQGTLNP